MGAVPVYIFAAERDHYMTLGHLRALLAKFPDHVPVTVDVGSGPVAVTGFRIVPDPLAPSGATDWLTGIELHVASDAPVVSAASAASAAPTPAVKS